MNPLIPATDLIQVPAPVFMALLLLVFPIHLLLMNAMLGATGIALVARLGRDEAGHRLAAALSKTIPVLFALAVNFGVAALLFVQVLYGHLLYTSSILMGVFWLSVVFLVMAAYFAVYHFDFRLPKLGRKAVWSAALAFVLLLVVAFFFTNNMTLMLRPETWSAYFKSPDGTLLNLGDPTLWPRYLHMLVGSLAVGSLFVAVFGKVYLQNRDSLAGGFAMRLGLNLFGWLTVAQVALGLLFLVLLPREVKLLFLGGSAAATTVFITAFVLTLIALALAFRRRPVSAAAFAVGVVVLMTFIRAWVRSG
ncbi:MAG: hypothetical protein GWN87_29060, partial [Desulfuromonadales bacterium]|nr:hypothetical protein [Desulfuromonadales bacterium]NIS43709.1 hypothetical protein [Desulfuromonadales bacterium]